MAAVDPGYALRLKNPALFTAASPAGAPAWGDKGVDSEVISSLANKADADAEAQRQANFLGGPTVYELHTVMGARRDLLLKCVTVVGDRLGYQGAGAKVFVLGVNENGNGTTTLFVIRKLP